jgi:chromosome segregation ATPase
MLEQEWLGFAVAASLGATLVLVLTFFRWRYRKVPVARKEWQSLVSGYVDMENLVAEVKTGRRAPQAELVEMRERLEHAIDENRQLRACLRDLEGHLESVTSEATQLVSSLRDNEQRWEQAEVELMRTAASLDEEVASNLALQDALLSERAEAETLRVANSELTARQKELIPVPPAVDLRDTARPLRRPLRSGGLSSQSRGTFPD